MSLIKSILIKKDVWDLIEIDSRPILKNVSILFDHKIKKDQIAITTTSRIIKEGFSYNFFNNVIDINDYKEI